MMFERLLDHLTILLRYPTQVKAKAACWLRTVRASTPSEFVTRVALSKLINSNLYGFGKDWITRH